MGAAALQLVHARHHHATTRRYQSSQRNLRAKKNFSPAGIHPRPSSYRKLRSGRLCDQTIPAIDIASCSRVKNGGSYVLSFEPLAMYCAIGVKKNLGNHVCLLHNIQKAVSTIRPPIRRTSALIYILPGFLSEQTHQILPDTQSFPDKRHSFRAQSTTVSSLIPIFQSHSKHAIMQMRYTFIAITYNLPLRPCWRR